MWCFCQHLSQLKVCVFSFTTCFQIRQAVKTSGTHFHPKCLSYATFCNLMSLFIYLEFYVVFKTVQFISQRVDGRAEETSTYTSSGFCTVNCRPKASNHQLSHLRPCREQNPGLRGESRKCYHSFTVAPVT